MDTALTFFPSEQEALRGLGVAAVILFGSRARRLARTASDYDIGVIRDASRGKEDGKVYDALYELLSPKIGKLVNIDIVLLDAAPLELQMHVARFGEALFEARAGAFARFKERVMDAYADFAPYRRMFQEQMLGRIPA